MLTVTYIVMLMKALILIRALEATGVTQYRIHKDTGISQPTLSRITNGQPDCLQSTIDKLEAYCRARGIDPDSQPDDTKSAA